MFTLFFMPSHGEAAKLEHGGVALLLPVALGEDGAGALPATAGHETVRVNLGGGEIAVAQIRLDHFHGLSGVEADAGAHVAQIMGADIVDAGDGVDGALDQIGKPLTCGAVPLHAAVVPGAHFVGGGGAKEIILVGEVGGAEAAA